MTDDAPGWQADPTGRHEHRYWDGTAWTDNVSDAGIASTDAYAVTDLPAPDVSEPEAPAAPVTEPGTPGWADPTTTAPVASADPTATWPTTPAPPPPPSYTPPAPVTGGPIASEGSGGSKKGLFLGIGVLAAVAIVVAFLLMGGDDNGDDRIRTQLAAQFRANSDLSGDQADCVADHVVDEMGADSFEDVDFSADEPPEAIADDLFAAAAGSLEACDIDQADFAGAGEGDEPSGDGETYGSDPELDALYDECEDGDYQACDDLYNQSPSGSEYEEFADTCGERNEPSGYCVDIYEGDGDDDGSLFTDGDFPANFEQQLANIYESSLGLSQEQAECLAGKLADAVSSGNLSEEEAFSEVFEFLSECDIDPNEISGN